MIISNDRNKGVVDRKYCVWGTKIYILLAVVYLKDLAMPISPLPHLH